MMTDSEKQQFASFTAQLAQLATASNSALTQPIALGLLPMLQAEIVAAFPTVGTLLKKVQADLKQSLDMQMKSSGPALWKLLHTRALAPVEDSAAEIRWLYGKFPAGLPEGCTCKTFYFQFLQTTKPDFADYFAWTVALHNAVNRKLGKPELTVDAARTLWSK